jgi:hypothetical protein
MGPDSAPHAHAAHVSQGLNRELKRARQSLPSYRGLGVVGCAGVRGVGVCVCVCRLPLEGSGRAWTLVCERGQRGRSRPE